jgi:hypothetical protein
MKTDNIFKFIIAKESREMVGAYRNLITVALSSGRRMAGAASWIFRVNFGRGAGYIGGRTFFLSWNSGMLYWNAHMKGDRLPKNRLQIGFTNNANRVPWLSH